MVWRGNHMQAWVRVGVIVIVGHGVDGNKWGLGEVKHLKGH